MFFKDNFFHETLFSLIPFYRIKVLMETFFQFFKTKKCNLQLFKVFAFRIVFFINLNFVGKIFYIVCELMRLDWGGFFGRVQED